MDRALKGEAEGDGAAAAVRPLRADAQRNRARILQAAESGRLGIGEWFDLLHRRTPFSGPVAPGWRLELEWL